MDSKLFCQCAASCGLGLVSLPRRGRSAWRHQYTVAAIWISESTIICRGALFVHHHPYQDAKILLSLCDTVAVGVHVRGHIHGRLPKDFFTRSEARFSERCAIIASRER